MRRLCLARDAYRLISAHIKPWLARDVKYK